jgi:hypothetical protein
MDRPGLRKFIIGGVIALWALATMPAAAQVQCPPGYYYSYGYGCVPASDAYNDMYGDDYNDGPPVYDTYGLAFGFGGGRNFHGGGGGRGFSRGGGGGGGFHGGGGHGGGGAGGHAGGGGGHGGGRR